MLINEGEIRAQECIINAITKENLIFNIRKKNKFELSCI